MSRNEKLALSGLSGAALLLLLVFIFARSKPNLPPSDTPKAWRQEGIEATYVGAQLKEVDKTHSSLILSYDLKNNSDGDYRLTDGPDVLIMSRLKSNGSLSQEEPVHLSYPVFLPAGQRARLAIEIARAFAWPAEGDREYDNKLRDFVKERLKNVGEFVVFDGPHHNQLELPGAWQELQATTEAN